MYMFHVLSVHTLDLLTTPQLHYMVKCTNSQGTYGEPSEDGYCRKLAKALEAILPKNVLVLIIHIYKYYDDRSSSLDCQACSKIRCS